MITDSFDFVVNRNAAIHFCNLIYHFYPSVGLRLIANSASVPFEMNILSIFLILVFLPADVRASPKTVSKCLTRFLTDREYFKPCLSTVCFLFQHQQPVSVEYISLSFVTETNILTVYHPWQKYKSCKESGTVSVQ